MHEKTFHRRTLQRGVFVGKLKISELQNLSTLLPVKYENEDLENSLVLFNLIIISIVSNL